MDGNVNQMTFDSVKQALAKAMTADQLPVMLKAFTQSANQLQGLTAFSLEAPAKTLVPVITPLRNMLPRTTGGVGIQANWRAITGINSGRVSAGLAEGMRGGVISTVVKEYLAAFRGIGLDDFVTFEAEYAGEGFDDVKARATQGLLRSLMIAEEGIILGGNGSLALGTTPTPTVAVVAGAGALGAQTVSVVCIALTLDGVGRANLVDGVTPVQTITRADGTTMQVSGGAARRSNAGSVVIASGTDNAVAASVTPVRGAFGYAWYAGAAGSEKLQAITTLATVRITALETTTQGVPAAASTDNSTDGLVFNGLLTLCADPVLGAYYKALPNGTGGMGTPLTADGAGGIKEFDDALKHFWDVHKLSPTHIFVSSQEQQWIRNKVLTGSTNGISRFSFAAQQQGLLGGTAVQGYTNPFGLGGAKTIPIQGHPNLPPGTVLFLTTELPYQLSGVTDVMKILCRRDYFQIEWPMQRRRYEYGVYADEVLQHYAPFSMGVITNIAAG